MGVLQRRAAGALHAGRQLQDQERLHHGVGHAAAPFQAPVRADRPRTTSPTIPSCRATRRASRTRPRSSRRCRRPCRPKTTEEWIAILQPKDVFCERVNNYTDYLEHPHVKESGAIDWIEQERVGRLPVANIPGLPRAAEHEPQQHAPHIGEDGPTSWASWATARPRSRRSSPAAASVGRPRPRRRRRRTEAPRGVAETAKTAQTHRSLPRLPRTASRVGSASTQAGRRFLRFLPLCPHPPGPVTKTLPPRREMAAAGGSFVADGQGHAVHSASSAVGTPIPGNGRADSRQNSAVAAEPLPTMTLRSMALSTGP